MDTTGWDDLEELFGQALALEPAERASFLDEACRDNLALRQEIDSLLAHYEQAPNYFDDLADAMPMPALPFEAGPTPAPTDTDPYKIQGTTISHYRVLEKLGGGGMGVVYKAQDTQLGRTAALKFLPPHLLADEHAKQRFVAEAQAASALDHPNICTIYEIGETEAGQLFIAMACYDGQTLKKKIQSRILSVEDVIDYTVQMARGLSKAHARGIVHRDVKPANVMVTHEGVVKVLDFGLAKMADVQLTKTGTTMGTIAYMSPEQTRGAKVDHRTDVWSLGVVLYEMLTGQRPFKGDYDQAIVYSILHEDPPPITSIRPALPEELEHIVTMCLEKDVALRYPSIDDLLADLEVLTHPTGSGSMSMTSAALRAMHRRRTRTSRKAILLGAGVLLVLVAVLAVFLFRPQTPPQTDTTTPPLMHLAVLPFDNVGGDPQNQAFVDGLVYTVTTKLAGMAQFQNALSVVPARDVITADIANSSDAVQTLKVNFVIQGSVQRADDVVRLTLDLVDTQGEAPRVDGSLAMDRPLTNVLALQDSVVLQLAGLLDVHLNPQAEAMLLAGGTTVSKAFDYYTQGLGFLQHYEEEDKIDAAIGLFDLAVQEDPNYALAHAALGEAYWRKYEASDDAQWVEAAVENGNKAVALDDDLAPVRVTLGMIYKGTGEYEKAEQELLRALAIDSSNAFAHQQLAATYYYLNQLDRAEQGYKQAIALKPDHWGFRNNLGFLYNATGRHAEAIEHYQKVIDLRPDNPWGYNNLAAQYQRLGRTEDAIPLYQQATRVNPNAIGPTALAYRNLGGIFYAQDNFTKAAQMYEKAVETQSTTLAGWNNLGNSLYWSGEQDKAREAWQRMIELAKERLVVNPNHSDALGKLGIAYAKLQQREQALTFINRLLALELNHTSVLATLGKTYEILEDRTQALHYIEAALKNGYTVAQLETSAWLDALRADEHYPDIIKPYRADTQEDED